MWHKYPDEIPTEEKDYLVYVKTMNGGYYDVCDFVKDLYKLDVWNFNDYKTKHKIGFVIYDGDYGYVEIRKVIAWCEIEEYKGV